MSDLVKTGLPASYVPQSFTEWNTFCEWISKALLCPQAYRGKPADVFIACQFGLDVGLKPMQALHSIAVINGRPCLWGDGALGIVMAHPDFEDIKETGDDNSATCTIKRRNRTEVTRTFTREQAEKAGLFERGRQNKNNPTSIWDLYTARMLQMRARGFAMRDSFPDALKGLGIGEEVRDYDSMSEWSSPPYATGPIVDKTVQPIEPTTEKPEIVLGPDYVNYYTKFSEAVSVDEVKNVAKELKGDKVSFLSNDERELLRKVYQNRMSEIVAQGELIRAATGDNQTEGN